jgi:hypothetical protein
MSSTANPHPFDAPAAYCIVVRGSLGPEFTRRFAELTVIPVPGDSGGALTMLVGRLPDQATLLGVLNFLYNLTIPIWMVQQLCQQTVEIPDAEDVKVTTHESDPSLRTSGA